MVGMDPDDNWFCYQFDVAVFVFGRHVNNKLAEKDKDGNPKYKIEDLLAGQEDEFVSISQMMLASDTMVMAF